MTAIMDDRERRQILNALDSESKAEQRRVLDTLNAFRNWMMLALSLLYRKLKSDVEKLWKWLKRMW